MKKNKYLLAMLFMLSTSLVGCQNEIELKNTLVEESIDDDSDLVDEELEEEKDDEIFKNKNISESGLYDDKELLLLELYNPIKKNNKKLIVKNTHHIILDSEGYKDIETFWADAIKESEGFLSEEQVLKSKVYVIINTYESISSPNITYNEKSTIIKVNGTKLSLSFTEENISIPKNDISVYMRTLSNEDSSVCKWAFVQKEDHLVDTSEKSLITKSNLSTGVYTKEELIKIEKDYNKKKTKKKTK